MANLDSFFLKWSPRMLSLLRIAAALLFMQHGSQKLFAFPGGQPVPPLFSLLGVAGLMEFFGGLFLLLGLFTRPVALLLAIEMAVAYFKVHAPQGFWPLLNQGELAILYGSVFFYLAFAGGGWWSVDRFRQTRPGTD